MIFLDTEVTMREATIDGKQGLYLIPRMYSKIDRHTSIPSPIILPFTSHNKESTNLCCK